MFRIVAIFLISGGAAAALSLLGRLARRVGARIGGRAGEEVQLTVIPVLLAALPAAARGPEAAGIVLGALGLTGVWGTGDRPLFSSRRGLALSTACAVAVLAGLQIAFVRHPFSGTPILLGALAAPATALWLLALSAAFYTSGRLDGLPLPLTMVAALTFLAVMLAQRQELPLAQDLLARTGGAATGLLFLAVVGARPPARGSGAIVFGFLLACASVVGMSKSSALLTLGVPLVAFAIPLLGMTAVAFDRVREAFVIVEVRQDAYSLLLNRGLPRRRAIIFMTAVEAYLGVLALALAVLPRAPLLARGGVLVLGACLGLPLFGRLLARLGRATSARDDAFLPRVLDVKVDPISMHEAVGRIEEFVDSRRPHHIVTGDTPALARAVREPQFRAIVNAAHMVTADGIGVVWAARMLGLPVRERVSGVDLMEAICAVSARKGYRVFFLGGRPGVPEAAAAHLAAQHPGLAVGGTHHGYFGPHEEGRVLRAVREAGAEIVFVAMGSPRQECWIHAHLAELGAAVCMGVGGSFDVFAGRLPRAPLWMRQLGLEWVYRVLYEPWRLRRLAGVPTVIASSVRRRIASYWS